jgi:hypothetical protein
MMQLNGCYQVSDTIKVDELQHKNISILLSVQYNF